MSMFRRIAIGLCLIFLAPIVCSATIPPRKLLEIRSSDSGWESDMAALDLLAKALGDEPESVGYIIVYAPRRARRNEVEKRRQCMKSYLLERRGVGAERIKVVRGGYGEHAMIELWIVPPGETASIPSPTVKPKDARLLRSRTKYHCQN